MPFDVEKKIRELDRKKDKQRIKIKNSEDRDAFQRVFDSRTLDLLQKLLNNGTIQELVGIISQGKEANVYFAIGENDRPIAIKIYKIDIQSSRWMKNYITGDPRFKKTGSNPDQVIFTWCKKEFRNLKQIYNKKINCPEPLFAKNNILIMSYIGDYDGTPALLIKDAFKNIIDLNSEMSISIQFIRDLYQKAGLVHGDLSEFNILYHNKEQVLIDVSQSVSTHHPRALFFLSRDINNILNFYKKLNLETPNPLEIYKEILTTD